MDQKPESLSEAAGRCGATLTTRMVELRRQLPRDIDIDPATLQSAFALAFEQGANWAMDRALMINTKVLPPANRRST